MSRQRVIFVNCARPRGISCRKCKITFRLISSRCVSGCGAPAARARRTAVVRNTCRGPKGRSARTAKAGVNKATVCLKIETPYSQSTAVGDLGNRKCVGADDQLSLIPEQYLNPISGRSIAVNCSTFPKSISTPLCFEKKNKNLDEGQQRLRSTLCPIIIVEKKKRS